MDGPKGKEAKDWIRKEILRGGGKLGANVLVGVLEG